MQTDTIEIVSKNMASNNINKESENSNTNYNASLTKVIIRAKFSLNYKNKIKIFVTKLVFVKIEQKIISQQNQITDLVGRGMRKNLIINGFREEEGEN